MYKTFVVLACFTPSQHGRRLQDAGDLDTELLRSDEQGSRQTHQQREAMSMLLYALSPLRPELHRTSGGTSLTTSHQFRPSIAMSLADELAASKEIMDLETFLTIIPVDPSLDYSGQTFKAIDKATTTESLWKTIKGNVQLFNLEQCSYALNKLVGLNKYDRAGRDAILFDERYKSLTDRLYDRLGAEAIEVESLVEVFWSFATLQPEYNHHTYQSTVCPAKVFGTLLMNVAMMLKKQQFNSRHLGTIVWSLGKLWDVNIDPGRLLQKIEIEAARQINPTNCSTAILSGFEKFNYCPSELMPKLSKCLVSKKQWQVQEIAVVARVVAKWPRFVNDELLSVMASHVTNEDGGLLPLFTGKQLTTLVYCFARTQKTALLRDGQLDSWVERIRESNQETPLYADDARALAMAMRNLGLDDSWVKKAAVLGKWRRTVSGEAMEDSRFSDAELEEVFRTLDIDSSKNIDILELAQAVLEIYPEMSADAVQTMLRKGDTDGDGQISMKEFKQVMMY